jgi:methyltransferase (TIGR00027 family)
MKEDKPSATAYLIARSTLFLASDPLLGQLIPERSAELCGRFVGALPRMARLLDAAMSSRPLRPLARALEHFTLPGIKLHYALRKRYLEEVARDAILGGFRQVVVIGAGFDTLALRLNEAFPRVRFFEVDHPATQRVKTRAVGQHDAHDGSLRFVSLDLVRGSLEKSLLSLADYDRTADTLFVAEGLLMYLTPAETGLIFEFIRSHSGAKSMFAFTFMETQPDGRIGFRQSSRAVDWWLRLRGETFKWGSHRARIADFLAARGYAAREIVTAETLRGKYLSSSARLKRLSLAEGECICVAELN